MRFPNSAINALIGDLCRVSYLLYISGERGGDSHAKAADLTQNSGAKTVPIEGTAAPSAIPPRREHRGLSRRTLMIQAKFSLEESQLRFLEQCKAYGFKDKSQAVRAALDYLHQDLEQRRLQESADAYAQIYDQDTELQELTASAMQDWPT